LEHGVGKGQRVYDAFVDMLVGGVPIGDLDPDAWRARVAFLPQRPYLPPRADVRTAVRWPLSAASFPDEPDANLGRAGIALVAQLLRELAGRAMVTFAAHTPELLAVADRVVVLETGRVVETDVRPPRG
jgi:ABC-type transport system involved in cytochrome bd biosynthesis fused ATPase/permease subunit